MKKPRAVILGAKGGIGAAVRLHFLDQGWQTIPVDSGQLNFDQPDSYEKLKILLDNAEADAIVNSVGVFVNGYADDYQTTMNVNFGSNWHIVRWLEANRDQNVRVVMVGSSSYTAGRRLYPLYSASKAALFNLWQSARDQFADTDIRIHLLNPVRTLTPMATAGKEIDPNLDYLQPEQVAREIFRLAQPDCVSSCVDMTFEDNK
jgi:ribitol-5-phosphate 2-dehydrogenase (NADP+) / D-ribitol-5-phosphate cytidylyltransferase